MLEACGYGAGGMRDLGDAAADAERSARYFMLDGIVLQYRMLRCTLKCSEEAGGYGSPMERKAAELSHVKQLAGRYPALVCVDEQRVATAGGDQRTLPVHFVPLGASPLVGKSAPWQHLASEIMSSGNDHASERVQLR